MSARVSVAPKPIEDPNTGDLTLREEVFTPDKNVVVTENYVNEENAHTARVASSENPFETD